MVTWKDILETEIEVHFNEFNRIYKCLNKKNIPKKETTDAHINTITKEFNEIILITSQHFDTLQPDEQTLSNNLIDFLRDKIIRIFTRIKSKIKVPTQKSLIDTTILNSDTDDDEEDDMAQEPTDFLRLAAQTINKNYSGDPLALTAFINSIELLETVVIPTNVDLLKRFILTKLEGKALEAVPANPATIVIIKDALKNCIKPDNSKIIEGRMLSLKNDNMTTQDFSKKAEELADALKRTLIVEGISEAKANEMTIDKTVEMCRATARTNLVKSVLASSTYTDSKTVIAKFLVESNIEAKEKQILTYKSFRNDNRYKNNNYRGNSFNRNHQRLDNNFRSYRDNNQSQRYGNNFNNRFSKNNNYSQNRRGIRNKGYNNNYNRNANVRVTDAKNSVTPQGLALGDLYVEHN